MMKSDIAERWYFLLFEHTHIRDVCDNATMRQLFVYTRRTRHSGSMTPFCVYIL